MSYYNSEFDMDFKRSFSSSYVNFSNKEITNMALNILSELTKDYGHNDQKFINRLKNKKVHEEIIKHFFTFNKYYNETYKNYLKSANLLELFNVSSQLLQISDNDKKKKFVYSKLKRKFYNQEIKRYAEYENIPFEFALLSLDKNCIKHLVGFFLKKHLNTSFNTEILDSCKKNSNSWLINNELLTPYVRTGELQKYLYALCNKFKGSELQIPSKLMRIILSTARLHFMIMDEGNLNPSELMLILQKQKEASKLEGIVGHSNFYNNKSVPRELHKRYIKNWRKRHLAPFFIESELLEYISKLDNFDPMHDVKLALLSSEVFIVRDLNSFDFPTLEEL